MRVDLCRFRVGVAGKLLNRSERLAGRCQPRGERVSEVVEANDADAGLAAGLLEASRDLAAVQRLTGERVREDQIVVGRERGAPRPGIELADESVGEGNRAPCRQVRLSGR